MQHLIIKNGYRDKYIKNLMKIHKAEAIFSVETEPIDIKEYSSEILKAAFLKLIEKNRNFRFKAKKTGVFLINKKLFASLLITLCRTSNKIEVDLYKEKILIKATTVNLMESVRLLNSLKATYFFETKTETLSVLINAPKTDKNPLENIKDWEYILNPLSVVNIYLN